MATSLTRAALALAAPLCLALLAAPTPAQLADLQPGPNFADGVPQFGNGRSENIDLGDVDNDGDLDAIVGNGGDGVDEPNRIFINNGGLQGGTVGTFTNETSTRFAGVPNDRTRDIEFVDFDNDGDLDIYVSNRGTVGENGQPSRFYTNLGGLQAGTIGFYAEETDSRWGVLLSVPPARQILGGNQGPFRDFTCDCDFGDLDDDGDLDLFHSSYGPAIDGSEPSRVFLNDGTGVFDEVFPWVDPAADISTHTLDIDLADFDGDFDIDVVNSSRDSQARVFMNNLYNGIGGTMFTDITQTALLDTGAGQNGTNNYECEVGDVDGDGDIDVFMKNYDNFWERILTNEGFTPGVGFEFEAQTTWVKGDPFVDETEIDFVDYDSDNDLDIFVANFVGENYLYQSGLSQGLDPDTQGLYHRTGTTTGGSLAAGAEMPVIGNGGQSLDGEAADIDNDGDQDLILANDFSGTPNRLFVNVLGVPDTHAPSFHKVTVAVDKPAGSTTRIHAAVRDNAPWYIVNMYRTNLLYSVDGGADTVLCMTSQGAQQFVGVIPDVSGVVSYRVESTDRAGNTGVSGSTVLTIGPGGTPWTNIGFALAGVTGEPGLVGTGALTVGSPGSLELCNAAPNALAMLFASLSSTPTAFKGGTLAAFPFVTLYVFGTNQAGELDLAWPFFPPGLPPGIDLYVQYGIADAAGPSGASLSNAVHATIP